MRSRSGLVVSLIFGVVLLLCIGGGAGAYLLVSRIEGRGADSATAAAETVLRAIFLERDQEKATDYLCTEVDPQIIKQKIDEVNDLLTDNPDATFSWEMTEKSRTRIKAVLDVHLHVHGSRQELTSHNYEITTQSDGGWRVCGLKRVRS